MLNAFDIRQGNSLEMIKNYRDNAFDYVFTSPPYNRKRNDKYNYYDDNVDYYKMLRIIIDESLRVSNKYVFINLQKNYYNKQDVFKVIGHYSNKIIDMIIWNKANPMPASGTHITNAYEMVLVLSNKYKSLQANTTYTKNVLTTPVYSNNPYKKIHRAVMNDQFANEFFDKFIEEGSTVLDPFSGMGTTGVACLNHHCDYYGIEMSQQYVDLSVKRLTKLQYDLIKG